MMHGGYFDTTRKCNHSPTLTPTVVGGRRSLPSEICAQTDPPSSRNADFYRFPVYNVSTVRDSEKSSVMTNIKSTTGFSTSYEWSACVTPKSRKGGSKSEFFVFFLSKSQRLIVSGAVNLVRRRVKHI